MLKKRKTTLFYASIIVIQVLVVLYWASCKENYYIDELYSLRCAQGFIRGLDEVYYITDGPDFKFNEWNDNSVLKSYLIMSPGHRVFDVPLGVALRKLLLGKTYWGLLNIVESIAEFHFVSVIPAILLNVLFFAVFQISLICLMKNLKMDIKVQYLFLAVIGFCGYMISLAVYIRFYMFAMMLMIILLNCFYRLWSADTWRKVVLWETLMLIVAYFSYKNSEFFIPFIGAYMFSFLIALLARKKWKQLFINIGLFISAFIYVAFNTILFKVLINPHEYAGIYDQYSRKAQNIRNISIARASETIVWLFKLFRDALFGSSVTLCVAIGALIAWLIVIDVLGERKESSVKERYSDETVYVFVLVGAIVIYSAFIVLVELNIWRYYCYAFVAITVVIWYAVDRKMKRIDDDRFRKALTRIITVLVITCAVTPFIYRNIEYIYEDERTFIDKVKDNRFLDVVLFVDTEDGNISKHDTYDCVNMISSEQKIYVADYTNYGNHHIEYPDVFMLWSHCDNDLSVIKEDLNQSGYSVDDMGRDHCSQVFFCKKMSRAE